MWISKSEYERLKTAENGYWNNLESYRKQYRVESDKLINLEKENNKLKQELNEWKQKYADEFQKRLEVIEYIDCIRKMP